MDIIISDNWLREYLDTSAKPGDIAKYVSLCGPSIERIENKNDDYLYHVEITTNRIDCVSVYGFAREVAAILPRFNIKAKLKPLSPQKNIIAINKLPFKVISNKKLVKRTIGVVITNIKNWKTTDRMKKRLESSGVRSLNAVVDITNYIMLEVGHPSHAFDYDKIKNKIFLIRESKKGENVTSFDGKTYSLPGGDIVFDDGEGSIIDLPGIIGTKNSVVDKNTKRVFFFVDNNDPSRIRNTSMTLAIRTMAAAINEKGVDPELAETAIYRGIELFKKVCKADVASKIYDNYPNPYKSKAVKISKIFIDKSIGIDIPKTQITKYLSLLEFKPKWSKNILTVNIPSFRADDINIPEDLIEEIARMYGYHNIPSKLMSGELPDPLYKPPFATETIIKEILKSLGATEIYTLSLVPKDFISKKAIILANPLGKDTEYLRTSLRPSLIQAAENNKSETKSFHLFEMANIYIPLKDKLPNEKMILSGIIANTKYRKAKGFIEMFLANLNIDIKFNPVDCKPYQTSKRLEIITKSINIGEFGVLKEDFIYYEFDVEKLSTLYKQYSSYIPIPKYPPQTEDITIQLPPKTVVNNVIQSIKQSNNLISKIELKDIYNNSYTFHIEYQSKEKTLIDKEVEKIRRKIINKLEIAYNTKLV